MTLVNCGLLPMPLPLTGTAAGSNMTIDAADEYVWAPHTIGRSGGGNITHVHFRTNTVTTGATVDVRVEAIGTAGQPFGTLFGTNTNGAQVIADGDDNVLFRTALTAAATVVLGSNLVVLIKNPTASFGTMNIARGISMFPNRGWPHVGGPLVSDKTNNATTPFVLEYSDGYMELPSGVLPGCYSPSTLSLSTSTNPDEIGILFTAPFDMRVSGFWFVGSIATSITYRIALYESGNDTPIATATRDSDFSSATSAIGYSAGWDSTATGVTLAAGTAYRLTFVALSGTSSSVYDLAAYNNAMFDCLGFPGCQKTVRNRSGTTDPDAAAWTETSTRRVQIGVIIDQLDDGAGAGVPKRIIGG